MLDVRYSTKFKKDFKTASSVATKCSYYNRQSILSVSPRRYLKKIKIITCSHADLFRI